MSWQTGMYATATEAIEGHMALCAEYDTWKEPAS